MSMNLPTVAEPAVFEAIDTARSLQEKIETKKARVGILGLGYVGLPLACAYAESGFVTTGFEMDESKIKTLSSGRSYIPDVESRIVQALWDQGKLRATSRFDELAEQDAVIICVPTPLRKTKEPDVSYIVSATQQIKKRIRPGQIVVLESTTYPGTTREILLSALSSPDFQVGRDFFLAFSPERVDPSNERYKIHNTPKVVGGVTGSCLKLAQALYGKIVGQVVPVSSVEVAEMTKLLENTFRAVNIGLVNEMAMMSERLGISIWEVIDAAKSKPFGFMPFYPGPGIGGHCIPLDPHYLAWRVKSLNFEPRFIELADAINSHMPEFVVNKMADILNHVGGKALSRSTILIIGTAYKKNTGDARESPAFSIIDSLVRQKKASVMYHDPFVPAMKFDFGTLNSVPLDEGTLRGADLVVIVTDHSSIDYDKVRKHAQAIFDTRNTLSAVAQPNLFHL